MAFGNVLFELTISIVKFVQRIIVQNIDVAVSSFVQGITRFVGMNCSWSGRGVDHLCRGLRSSHGPSGRCCAWGHCGFASVRPTRIRIVSPPPSDPVGFADNRPVIARLLIRPRPSVRSPDRPHSEHPALARTDSRRTGVSRAGQCPLLLLVEVLVEGRLARSFCGERGFRRELPQLPINDRLGAVRSSECQRCWRRVRRAVFLFIWLIQRIFSRFLSRQSWWWHFLNRNIHEDQL